MDWNDAEWHLQAAAADPFIVSVAEVGLSTSPTHARTQSIMPHADHYLYVTRAPWVCSGSFLLLISSTDAADTLLEDTVHRPRARAAALRVVGVALMLPFASSALLLVVLRGGCGALADLECCVMLVSIRMHGYWCVLVAYGAGTARGPVGYRFGALRGVLLHSNAKT